MIILDENKINRTDKEKLFIEDIQNKELVIKSIENELAFFRQLRGYNNGLDNNRLYQLDKCFNQGKDRLKHNFSNSVGYHRWNITDEELFEEIEIPFLSSSSINPWTYSSFALINSSTVSSPALI